MRTAIDAHMTTSEAMKLLGHSSERVSLQYSHPEATRIRAAMEQMGTGRTESAF